MAVPPIPDNTGKKYNRTVQDPRVDIFKQFYLAPTSHTFMNIRQSALRAGYTDQYARNISVQRPKWWVELTESAEHKRAEMMRRAEGSLLETITSDSEDSTDKKLKHDASKFVTERLGKDLYSTRQELTDKGGRRLFQNQTQSKEEIELNALFQGVEPADQGASDAS